MRLDKEKKKRKRREKIYLKGLLPASRNSRAISMLRSPPSLFLPSSLSLSWKEILLRKQMRPWIMERVHCLPPLLSLHLCSPLIAYLGVALLNCLVIDAKYIYTHVSLYFLYRPFPIFPCLFLDNLKFLSKISMKNSSRIYLSRVERNFIVSYYRKIPW